jgi:membrane peptidoglycan carboxypeptidase
MKKSRRRRRKPASDGRKGRWPIWRILRPALPIAAALLLVASLVSIWYAERLSTIFEARELEVSSRLLGRSFRLERGAVGSPEEMVKRLDRLGYRRVRKGATEPGTYSSWGNAVQAHLRPFDLDGTQHPDRTVRVRFQDGRIDSVDAKGAALEPETLTLFYGPEMEERELVTVEGCPKNLINAIIAAEDRRFFTHPGLDPLGIVRAAWANATSGSLSQGGSTLTQQLAKNLYFTNERSFARKAKEAFAAVVLEAHYSKERLLRAYLNEVYLGQRGPASVRGVARAARHYFGKPVADLTLSESAIIAGMIQAPGRYDPRLHREAAIKRRDLVLESMVAIDAITPEQRRAAEAEPVRTVAAADSSLNARAAYVTDAVRQQLIAENGPAFWQRGLEVHSSIDPIYQEAAEAAVKRGLDQLAKDWKAARKGRDGSPLQAALVSIDLRDGSILALVGGRSFPDSQFNRVTSARRQPGSLFKPVIYLAGLTHPSTRDDGPGWLERMRRRWNGDDTVVSAPMLSEGGDHVEPVKKKRRWWNWRSRDDDETADEEEKDLDGDLALDPNDIERPPTFPLTAATILYDEPYEVTSGGKAWSPENDDREFRGKVTAQLALEESLNVPTARLAAAIGLDRVARTAKALGIRSAMPEIPSIALGTAEVTPLEMASAFATIARAGAPSEPYLIRRIEDGDGTERSLNAGWPYPADNGPSMAAYPGDGVPGRGSADRGTLDRGAAADRRPGDRDLEDALSDGASGGPSRSPVLHRAEVTARHPQGGTPQQARIGRGPTGTDNATGDSADGDLVPRREAQLLTALLGGVMAHGTGRSASTLGFVGTAAGKTGTSDGGRDLWFCGYTPDLLTLVWVGFDDSTPTHLSGARGALPIWVDYMKAIGAETQEPFEGDERFLWALIDPATGQLARGRCPEVQWAPFIPGTEPVLHCIDHRSFWDRFTD